jgi:dolichol-phosphate mannosyltransferase
LIYILLPAYNEERALQKLIPDIARQLKLARLPYTLCLSDDGSTDQTASLVQTFALDLPLQYLRHDINRGYGAALRTGIVWAIRNAQPEDVLVMMDSDNTHSPAYIPLLVRKLEEGFEVVTASYVLAGGKAVGVPVNRRILSWGINTLLKAKCRVGVGTYTNGFRAYRIKALQDAFLAYKDKLIQASNFAGGTELFLKVVKTGARAGEIPFILHYENRGVSKINIPKTVAAYLKLLAL